MQIKKQHSRSLPRLKKEVLQPGFVTKLFPVQGMSFTEKRLRFYTDKELIARKKSMLRRINFPISSVLKKKIKHELFVINSLLS